MYYAAHALKHAEGTAASSPGSAPALALPWCYWRAAHPVVFVA